MMPDAFLAPLAQLILHDPEIEAHVLWYTDGQWPDASEETLDSEEVCFYAEGLLDEGFHLIWQIIGEPDEPAQAILLLVWQGDAPPPPVYGPVLQQARWPQA